MTSGKIDKDEIESFNLADLNVSVLDVRLELTALIPQCLLIGCDGNCQNNCGTKCNINCSLNTGACNCHSN